ncbi:hypothetical protein DID88_008062 [Monilinia fructigena]|uniref:Band 7 domain-containing protein n=1 Tax=Monilinia fructigena TaxID=38457 RepID=A0A395J9A4_9HELO|nr:hypothetical protein DID88_008062 [Monilinia fructigena]
MLLAESESRNAADPEGHLRKIVVGIIEGETRVLVSSMSIEKIFTERESFKKDIFKNIQAELSQFGLRIYNANVKELKDAPARVDVAEAQRLGTVGEAQRKGEQDRELAKVQAETAVQKTERDSEKARAEATLATRKATYNRDVNVAQIEATRATEVRDEELRRDVEVKRAQTELERLRASDVVKATILREAKQQAADAKNYEEQTRSNAEFYSQQKLAEARANSEQKAADTKVYSERQAADAKVYSEQKAADAKAYMEKARADFEFYSEQKAAEAKAYRMKIEAEAKFIVESKEAEAALFKTTKRGGSLAQANADAVRGLNPKMTIWNTGAQAGSNGTAKHQFWRGQPISMTLPEWQYGRLGHVPGEEQENATQVAKVNGKTNGGAERLQEELHMIGLFFFYTVSAVQRADETGYANGRQTCLVDGMSVLVSVVNTHHLNKSVRKLVIVFSIDDWKPSR